MRAGNDEVSGQGNILLFAIGGAVAVVAMIYAVHELLVYGFA